jgi:cytochrome c oxidase subunit 2
MTAPYAINDWIRTVLFLPEQASSVAQSIDHLHYFVIITTMGGATGIAVMAGYYILRYRRRSGYGEAPPPEVPTRTPGWLEGLIVGGLFSLFFAWWVIGFMQYLKLRVAPEDTYDVYVTAKQWMWTFSYPEGARTMSELYVPAGRPVKLIMTSRDVIHSFYVPDFRVKEDVIPGRYTTLWFTVLKAGRHRVFCAEYCGTNHSTMRAEVIALDPEDFSRWVERGAEVTGLPGPSSAEPSVVGELGPSAPMSLPRLGELVAAQKGCLRCHTLDGSPHVGPSWAGLYHKVVALEDGGHVIADEGYLTESMMDPNAKVVSGYKSVMPSYLGRLQPGEVGAIVQLIKSLGAPGREVERGPALFQPPPSQQGVPPPGVTRLLPATGEVEIGPRGQIAPRREQGGSP